MKHRQWYAFVAMMLVIFAVMGCSAEDQQNASSNEQPKAQTDVNDVSALNWYMPKFQAIDHTGKSFTSKDVEGELWLTNVIFTRCNNVCPPMTANMSKVQSELKKEGINIKIVSFSVDPEYDQPEVLTEFAKKYHADLSNWHFLTGYSFEDIKKITEAAFKSNLTRTKGPTEEVPVMISHPSRFYLIDHEGKVRKFYDGLNPDSIVIASDIKQLQNE